MTAASAAPAAPRVRPRRGLSWYYLGLEVKRQVSRPMTLVFCGAMPILFYLLFGSMDGMEDSAGRGDDNAVMLLFMAVYGAAMTAATAASTVAYERPLGWNRELRLTPLRPWAYIAVKSLNAMVGAVLSMALLSVVALLLGRAHMPAWLWLAGLGVGFVCGLTFGAVGLVLGLALKPETATGVLIPTLLVCCFLSGVFAIPLAGDVFGLLQKLVPLGGAVNLICALFGPEARVNETGGLAVGDWRIWANLGGWLAIGLVGAAVAYARDTKRQ